MKLWGHEGHPACLSRAVLLPNSAFIPWPHAALWTGTCQEFPWGVSSGWALRLHQSLSGTRATINGVERFASKAQSWSEQEHGAGVAADCLAFWALHSQCLRALHALVASSWGFHHHGLRTLAKGLYSFGDAVWEWWKELLFVKKMSSRETLKKSIRITKMDHPKLTQRLAT